MNRRTCQEFQKVGDDFLKVECGDIATLGDPVEQEITD
jgi:hypothetical protein